MVTDPISLFGLLVIDKPAGITSRDAVNVVQRIVRKRFPKPMSPPKVGHAGTLDPLATGVLVIGVGAGVRLVPYLQQQSKRYEATFRLGQSSASGDLETPVSQQADAIEPGLCDLRLAASRLIGRIEQVPPAHSAIKVAGRKAYKSAHRGIAVEMPTRTVEVTSLELVEYRYPDLHLEIVCGSGTYIRTLGMDLARKAGTTAVMTSLRRVAIGSFSLARSISIDKLATEPLEDFLLPLGGAVEHLSRLSLGDDCIERLTHGICLESGLHGPPCDRVASGGRSAEQDLEHQDIPREVAAFDSSGRLRAILRLRDTLWCPYRVFPAGSGDR